MKKKLTRSEENKIVAGVLGGLASYYEHDPVLYRIAAIAFLLITGVFPGLFIYLAALLMMPKQSATKVDYEV
jgi:phage shock protein PspC (stress-responsive transcriptional regulator)